MAVKRYGPINDAGVVILEKEAQKTIQASQLGSTGYWGVLERGEVGALITTTSRKNLLAKTGGLIPESLLPDACQDFWDHGEGAGVLFLVRVTDGNETVATLTSFDRKLPRNPVVRWDADNGGGWGGRRYERVVDLDAVPGDILTETTVKLPDLFVIEADRLNGGTIQFTETGNSYDIVSNTAGDGVSGAVVTVAADSLLITDFASGTDPEVIIEKDQTDSWARERKLAVMIKDGQVNPTTEWGVDVYLNGEIVKSYPDLSSDPNAENYFVPLINDDPSNNYVKVTDLWVGGITAAVRPANDYGVIPTGGVAAKQLTVAAVAVDLSQANSSTVDTFTFGADVVPDTYTLSRNAIDWDITSVKQAHHTFPTVADAGTHTAENRLAIGFTMGGTPAQNDTITVHVLVLRLDEAIGGFVYPDVDNAPNVRFRITDNDETTVSIASGDMTVDGADGDNYRLEFPQELDEGYDGIAALTEQAFIDQMGVVDSPFNDTFGQGYGLIKLGTPGVDQMSAGTVDSVAVQQAGVAYAEGRNHQFRYEIPNNVTDEADAKDYVNNTLGRSDMAKVIFPSYAKVGDPVLRGLLKTVPLTGQVHGREALVAKNHNGYHKVAAGITVTLPRIRELPTGDTVLNGELLNPAGLQRVERKNGRYVIWGARLPSIDPAYRFSQHRELLSYYEHVLSESFDFVIFAINDPQEQPGLIAALKSFFYPEWTKRALRGDTFEDAAAIKIDDENNTDATRAAGDLNADITLRLADTVERFIISIGPRGVFEATAP